MRLSNIGFTHLWVQVEVAVEAGVAAVAVARAAEVAVEAVVPTVHLVKVEEGRLRLRLWHRLDAVPTVSWLAPWVHVPWVNFFFPWTLA